MFEKILKVFRRSRGQRPIMSRETIDDLELTYLACEGTLEYVHPAHCLDLIDEIRRLHGWPKGMLDKDRYRTEPPKTVLFEFPPDLFPGEEPF